MKINFIVFLLITGIFCNAQDRIPTEEEAARFFEREDKTGFIFRTITIDDALFELYARRSPGDVIVGGSKIYKILGIKTVHIQNFGSIQLQQTLAEKEVHELEKIIIEKYNSGTPFSDLNQEYGENKNAYTDDIDYPIENMGNLGREMEKHDVGELFVVNDPPNNSYKVIIKNRPAVAQMVVQVFEADYK